MNPKWFGDSYDIVKKFIVDNLKGIGYEVYIDPMFTGDWNGKEKDFIKFIGAKLSNDFEKPVRKSALFIDPDTGVKEKATPKHIDFKKIIKELRNWGFIQAAKT